MKSEYLFAKLERMPMLKATVPFAAGILFAGHYALPLWLPLAGFMLCAVVAIMLRSTAYMLSTLFLFGICIFSLHERQPSLPHNLKITLQAQIAGYPSERGAYNRVDALVEAWRNPEHRKWHASGEKIVIYADSAVEIRPGERICCAGYIRPFAGGASGYRSLMEHRGFAGTMRLYGGNLILYELASGNTLHTAAVSRLSQLGLAGDAGAVCRAMATGEKSTLTPSLRSAYARSGTSHLLAVSGLHVGIVFALVNLLLAWMPLLRRGHLLRNAAAIACIWLYASATGFAPGTVRAAVMFSVLQLSLASTSGYTSANALAMTAFGMLIWNPHYLFDISFRLSFIAVAAIIVWSVPLCRRWRTGWRIIDIPVATLIVSTVAAIATAPLVCHTFGIVSIAGIVVNPLAIALATAIVLGTVVWIIVPCGFLLPIFYGGLSVSARALNGVVEWTAAQPWAAAELRLTAAQMTICYAIFIVGTLLVWCREPKKSVHL